MPTTGRGAHLRHERPHHHGAGADRAPEIEAALLPGDRFHTSDESERARYGVHALDRRAAEAAAVRNWTTNSLAGDWADQPLLVCGGLNDTLDAATTQLIFGPPGSQIGTGGFDHPEHGDPQRLRDLGYAMGPPNDFSGINQGRPELIDHILVSHAVIGHPTDAATVPLEVPSIGVRPQVVPRTDPGPTTGRSWLTSTCGHPGV